MAIIVENKEDIAAFANYAGPNSSAPAQEAAPVQAAPAATPAAAAPAQNWPEHMALEMPNLSPTMEKVSLVF